MKHLMRLILSAILIFLFSEVRSQSHFGAFRLQPEPDPMPAFVRQNLPPPPPERPYSCMLPRRSAQDLPLFCKMEHWIDTKTPVQLRFRLGSLDYVDWLEGKNRFSTFVP